MPRVSVIIPTYNRAHYIRATLESVLAQTYRDFEIIVVDDGSTDDTATVMKAFEAQVNYQPRSHSGRPAFARNVGLQLARGEYIAFLDSDDVFVPERLEKHAAYLDAHPEVALVYSDSVYFTDEGMEVGFLVGDAPAPHGQVFTPLLMANCISTCSVTLRQTCLAQAGVFDEAPILAGVEDYDLWLQIAARYPLGYVAGALSRVRVHSQNISGGDKLGQYLGILAILAKMRRQHSALVQPHLTLWRQRCSLLHLATARAYARRHLWNLALRQAALAVLVCANPRWVVYLLTTPHPARLWLKNTVAQLGYPGLGERR